MSEDSKEVLTEVKKLERSNSEVLANLKDLFVKASEEKKARDGENSIVKETVKELTEIRKQLAEISAKLTTLQKEIGPQKRTASPESIKQQIEALEYDLQLNYSQSKEKVVAKKVRELNQELKNTVQSTPKLKELSQLKSIFRELKNKLSNYVKELKARTTESEKHHQLMIQYLKKADELKTKLSLSELEKKRLTLRKIRSKEKTENKKQRDAKSKSRNVKAEKQMKVVREKAQVILQRFKQGEKISLEELQVLQASGIEI